MTALRVVRDEDYTVPQLRAGCDVLAGDVVPLSKPASVVLADVVAILAGEDTAEEVRDYVLAVVTRLAGLYGLPMGPGAA